MPITAAIHDRRLDLVFQGRLDAFASQETQQAIEAVLTPEVLCAVADLSSVDYISSAGLRLLLVLYKKLEKQGGALALAGARDYCRNVIDVAGFTGTFHMFNTAAEAAAYCEQIIREKNSLEQWEDLECLSLPTGWYRILPGRAEPGAVEILGDVKDVLYSRITPAQLHSIRFSETEYSIGLGGLGERLEDYYPLMGEMITIGGTMVWLPTDQHDTPDFLIPKSDKGQVTLRTGFNTSLAGGFNELMMFESQAPAGAPINRVYRDLFDAARRRRPDFKGVLALVLRAQMGAVFGSGIKKSPIKEFAPANGEMVTHPSNVKDWFDFDATPRHTQVTALICGIGVDLTADLAGYDPAQFSRVFYLNPANPGDKNEMLHNHAVIFNEQPLADRAVDLEREIGAVVENGEFIDMRHLLDNSTITRAFLGVSYIQDFRSDCRGGNAGIN